MVGSAFRIACVYSLYCTAPTRGTPRYIPFVGDWCDVTNKKLAPGGRCPNWQDPATAGGNPDLRSRAGLGINRKTWSWNAAAAVFGYGYGTLAELKYKYVGQDQLIGGTWPDVRSPPLASAPSSLPRLDPSLYPSRALLCACCCFTAASLLLLPHCCSCHC